MGIGILKMSPEVFVFVAQGLSGGDDVRQFVVSANPLPDDARVVRLSSGIDGTIELGVESAEYDDGFAIPSPQITTIRSRARERCHER